jgi:hypothetical protein
MDGSHVENTWRDSTRNDEAMHRLQSFKRDFDTRLKRLWQRRYCALSI